MALSIKQKLLAFHIDRRDRCVASLARLEKIWAVEPTTTDPETLARRERVKQNDLSSTASLVAFHTEAVEFLSEVKP